MTKKPAAQAQDLIYCAWEARTCPAGRRLQRRRISKSFMRRSGSWRWRMTFSDERHLQDPFAGARMLRDLLWQEGDAIGWCLVAEMTA